jgi:poly-gamma-glutamate synthase PgsB/CapB
MKIVISITVVLLCYGVIEYVVHLRRLYHIPIRIHVNGTRGKSSVTRLIAAGLNHAGISTIAKTTGGAACIIFKDGTEQEIVRRGIATIREQLWVVRQAAKHNAQCLVIECMAVRTELQEVSEHRMLKSHIGVITNIRRDHLDQMGPKLQDVARSISLTIPKGGEVFTAESRFANVLAERAKQLGCEFHLVDCERAVTSKELSRFRYAENAENIDLALNVCEHLGVERNIALKGMQSLRPHIDTLQQFKLECNEKTIHFVSAFAANDRESIMQIFTRLNLSPNKEKPLIVIVNLRADRPKRARELGELLGYGLEADHILLVGELTSVVKRIATKTGCPQRKLLTMKQAAPNRVIQEMVRLTPRQSVVVGIGNMTGFGRDMLEFMKSEAKAV